MADDKRYILAYGGLRDGMSLSDFYKDVGYMKYIKTVEQTGYNLYALGNLPAIRPARIIDGTDRVMCDIMECDESTFDEIYKEATSNNFFMMKIMHVVNEMNKMLPCYLFVWKDGIPDRYRVMSGDWWRFILKDKNNDSEKKQETIWFDTFVPSNN